MTRVFGFKVLDPDEEDSEMDENGRDQSAGDM